MKIENIEKIVVHNGGAHMDDFLSVCVLLHKYRSIRYIDRISSANPMFKQSKTNLSEIWVDIGGKYNPDLLQFDHHQLKQTVTDPQIYCSFNQVMLWLYPNLDYTKLLDILPQFRYIGLKDCFGPNTAMVQQITETMLTTATDFFTPESIKDKELIKTLGSSITVKTNSLIEHALLQIFASKETWNRFDPIIQMMEIIGQQIDISITKYIDFEETLVDNFKLVNQSQIAITELKGNQIIYPLFYKFLRDIGAQVKLSIARSSQTTGYGMTRTTKYGENLDFNILKESKYKDSLEFVHANGFYVAFKSSVTKAKALEIADWVLKQQS